MAFKYLLCATSVVCVLKSLVCVLKTGEEEEVEEDEDEEGKRYIYTLGGYKQRRTKRERK